jgi:hypothetical protein
MNGSERGMVKWSPYQSLVEQATSLAKMRHRKNKVDKPIISNEQANEINEILTNYNHEAIIAKYWEDGCIYYLEGTVEKIDPFERRILIGGKRISFASLVQISRE